jgi:membrane protein implicated in regulation of membrane protease activity
VNSSVGAGLVLVVVALSVGTEMLGLPTLLAGAVHLVLILLAVLIGSRVRRSSSGTRR